MLGLHPVEGPEGARRLLNWKPVGDGERETPLGHGSTSVFDCVAGSSQHMNAFRLKLWKRPLERSQLLRAIRSPAAPVEKQRLPAWLKLSGYPQDSSIDELQW